LRAAAGLPANKAPATAAIPLLLAESYYALQDPAMLNMRYSEAVQVIRQALMSASQIQFCSHYDHDGRHCVDKALFLQNFARTAVTAYECGYSEDTLRQELEQATAQQSTPDSVKVLLHWHPLVSLLYIYTLYLL